LFLVFAVTGRSLASPPLSQGQENDQSEFPVLSLPKWVMTATIAAQSCGAGKYQSHELGLTLGSGFIEDLLEVYSDGIFADSDFVRDFSHAFTAGKKNSDCGFSRGEAIQHAAGFQLGSFPLLGIVREHERRPAAPEKHILADRGSNQDLKWAFA
jgi:hypothetical protein